MQIVFMTQVTGILKPFAWILGMILNYIYEFVSLIGIENLALCIILFTFVVKMLMLPLTIKQQKFTKLSSKMNPELQKIQAKYKGKKDEDSMRRQQSETQAVYSKYGASPMSGCLPLLISLPILFALYKVIYAIPAYVTDIRDLYSTIANAVVGLGTQYGSSIAGFGESGEPIITSTGNGITAITQFITDNAIVVTNNLSTTAIIDSSTNLVSELHKNGLIDIFAKFNSANWVDFFKIDMFAPLQGQLQGTVDQIISVNNMFGLNILDAPKWNSISVIIPILAFGTQFLQGKLQGANNPKKADDTAAQTSNVMMTIMPIMSGFFCLMLPIGVGLYWIASAVFTILQTFFINKYLDKTDIDEMIEKNQAKFAKRNEKLGVKYDSKMAEVAKTSTKAPTAYDNSSSDFDNTGYKKNNKKKTGSKAGADYVRSTQSFSASSIAANANLLAARCAADKPEKKQTTAVAVSDTSSENQDGSDNQN